MSKQDMIDLKAFLLMLNLNVNFSFAPLSNNEKSVFIDLHPRDGPSADPGSSRTYKVQSDFSLGKIIFLNDWVSECSLEQSKHRC